MEEEKLVAEKNEEMEDFDEDSAHKSYKLYNFRRPDKFSKDNLRALRDIHREFSKAISLVLSGYLRMRVEIEIVSVDQLTYEEFVRSMPSPISVGVFEFEPLSGQILLGISFEVISCIVNRMLGGVGVTDPQARELTDIEKALAKLCKEPVAVYGSGRTDSGVHALGQAANFYSPLASMPAENYIRALNSFLPSDIRIMDSKEVSEDFSARKSATSRVYRYFIS